MKTTVTILTSLAVLLAFAGREARATGWDDSTGNHLWSDAENWTAGVPSGTSTADINDDNGATVGPTITGTQPTFSHYTQLDHVTSFTTTVAFGATLTVSGDADPHLNLQGGATQTLDVYGTVVQSGGNGVMMQGAASQVINIYSTGFVRVEQSNPTYHGNYGRIYIDPGTSSTINITGGNNLVVYGDSTSSDSGQSLYSAVTNSHVYLNGSLATTSDLARCNADGTLNSSGDYTTLIPEPATVAILGLGSLVLLRRRR